MMILLLWLLFLFFFHVHYTQRENKMARQYTNLFLLIALLSIGFSHQRHQSSQPPTPKLSKMAPASFLPFFFFSSSYFYFGIQNWIELHLAFYYYIKHNKLRRRKKRPSWNKRIQSDSFCVCVFVWVAVTAWDKNVLQFDLSNKDAKIQNKIQKKTRQQGLRY